MHQMFHRNVISSANDDSAGRANEVFALGSRMENLWSRIELKMVRDKTLSNEKTPEKRLSGW